MYIIYISHRMDAPPTEYEIPGLIHPDDSMDNTCSKIQCGLQIKYQDCSPQVFYATESGIGLKLEKSNTPQVKFGGVSYQPTFMYVQFGPVHEFKTDANIIPIANLCIKHIASDGCELLIHIPVMNKTMTPAAKRTTPLSTANLMLRSAFGGVSNFKMNEWQETVFTKFNVGVFLPRSGFFTYALPAKRVRVVVFPPTSSLNYCFINYKKNAYEFSPTTRYLSSNPLIQYNSSGPGLMIEGDDIYIDCSPSSSSHGTVPMSQKLNMDYLSSGGDGDSGDSPLPKDLLSYSGPVMSVVFGLLLLLIVYCLWFIIEKLIATMRGGPGAISMPAVVSNAIK